MGGGGLGLERTGVRGTEEENEEDVSRRKSVNQVRDRTDGPMCPADAKGRHTAVGLRPLCTPWHEAEFKENHL